MKFSKIKITFLFFILFLFICSNKRYCLDQWPLNDNSKKISGVYGDYREQDSDDPFLYHIHPSIDIESDENAETISVCDGEIKWKDDTKGYYNYIIIYNKDNNLYYYYAHIDKFNSIVVQGDEIEEGDIIAEKLSRKPSGENFFHLDFGIHNIPDLFLEPCKNPLSVFNYNDKIEPSFYDFEIRKKDNNKKKHYFHDMVLGKNKIYGDVELIISVYDKIGEEEETVASKNPGIYSLSYKIMNPPKDSLHNIFEYQKSFEFKDTLPITRQFRDIIYSNDTICQSSQHRMYYIVSNTDGDGILEEINGDQYWNTNVKKGFSNTSFNGSGFPDALLNKDAYFTDGEYTIEIEAKDEKENSKTFTQKVIIDNFLPFLEEIHVYFKTNDEANFKEVYKAVLKYIGNTQNPGR